MSWSTKATQVKGLKEGFFLRLPLSIRGIIPYNYRKRGEDGYSLEGKRLMM